MFTSRTMASGVPDEIQQRLISACVEDGASATNAVECTGRIVTLIARCLDSFELQTSLASSDRKELQRIASNAKKLAALCNTSSDLVMEVLDYTNPTRFLFSKSDGVAETTDLSEMLTLWSLHIDQVLKEEPVQLGRPKNKSVHTIAEASSRLWYMFSGKYPNLTRSKTDGEPDHELIKCIPLIVDAMPVLPELKAMVSERAIWDAMRSAKNT